MFVQTSLTNICSFNAVHLRCWDSYSTFVWKNIRVSVTVLCSFKNAVLALQIFLHDGHVAGQAGVCLCMDWWMNIICILMFFCSYVLIIVASCLQRYNYPCMSWGMPCLGTCMPCGCKRFYRHMNIRTKESHWKLKVLSSKPDVHFFFQCICI